MSMADFHVASYGYSICSQPSCSLACFRFDWAAQAMLICWTQEQEVALCLLLA